MKVNFICESLFLLLFLLLIEKVTCFDLKCPSLRLLNGRSRYTWRGRSVRFNCMRGFQLVGVKYATCMNGKWDADVPICVKFGCRAPSTTHVNGQFIESYRGAVVKIVCNPGYTLIGSPSVYCNGYRWNETFPVCKALNKNPSLSCNFENPDLCGWNQDPMHDFDWKWENGSSPMENASSTQDDVMKTDGHYMYMVNPRSRRAENDTARLYSPVYPPEFSNGSCFSFWYKMNHDATGILRVFVKPEGVMLSNLIPDFWINGNQGEKWQHGYFSIDTVDTPFQIVIEGVRGPDYSGDTAFDQVDLMSGEDCEALKQITTSTEISTSTSVNPDEEGTDNGSCKNLCEQMVENASCECHRNCGNGRCCQDYYYYCQPSDSNTTVTESESESSLSAISTTSTKPEVEESGDNNEMNNEIDSGKMIVDVLPENKSNSLPVNRSLNEIPKMDEPEAGKNKTEMKNSVVVAGKNTTEVKSGPEVFNSSKAIVRKIVEMSPRKFFTNVTRVEPKSNGSVESSGKKAQIKADKTPLERKPEVAISKTNFTATTTPATTPSRPLKPSKPNKLSFVAEKPSNPILSNESRFHKGKSKEPLGKEPPEAIKIDRNEENSGQNVRRIIEIGGPCLGVIIIIIILGVVWYGRSRSRKLDRDNMVEDSDVRYLTSDEVLDFTLARPADDDL